MPVAPVSAPMSARFALLAGLALALLPNAALAGNARALSDTEIYSGPASSHVKIGEIVKDEDLIIYGCGPRYQWCDVAAGDLRGWIVASDLAFAQGANFVPIEKLAPFIGVPVVDYAQADYYARHYQGTPLQAKVGAAAGVPGKAKTDQFNGLAAKITAEAENRSKQVAAAGEPNTTASTEAGVAVVRGKTRQATSQDGGVPGKALTDASIRTGPGSSFPRIDAAPSASELTIYSCTPGYKWCDIGQGDRRGYIYSRLLGVMNDGQLVAISDLNETSGVPAAAFSLEQYHAQHYEGDPWQGQRNGEDYYKLRGG